MGTFSIIFSVLQLYADRSAARTNAETQYNHGWQVPSHDGFTADKLPGPEEPAND
jgi:hypothetical protein